MDLESDASVFYGNSTSSDDAGIIPVIKSTFSLFSAVCFIVIFCISVPANGFLLWVLLRERAWKTTSDILLLQLTVSHLCFTVILPLEAYHVLHGWIFGDWVCGVFLSAYYLGLNSYVWILTAMTLHRYVAVVHASCLCAQAPQKCCVVMASSVIWLSCGAVSIKALVKGEVHEFDFMACVHAPMSFTMLLFDIYMQICFFFLIPSIVITFCCVHMWITIKQRSVNRHRQATRLILGLVVVFFLCVAPHNIIEFVYSLEMFGVRENAVEWAQEMVSVELILYTMLCSHCCLNPLFHMFGAQRFRRHLPIPCSSSSLRRDGSQNLSLMPIIPLQDASV